MNDTLVLLRRSLRHILRSPDTIISTAVVPIVMLLLFVYLLPGILITVASGISYTAFRLFTDVSEGILERFRASGTSTATWPR